MAPPHYIVCLGCLHSEAALFHWQDTRDSPGQAESVRPRTDDLFLENSSQGGSPRRDMRRPITEIGAPDRLRRQPQSSRRWRTGMIGYLGPLPSAEIKPGFRQWGMRNNSYARRPIGVPQSVPLGRESRGVKASAISASWQSRALYARRGRQERIFTAMPSMPAQSHLLHQTILRRSIGALHTTPFAAGRRCPADEWTQVLILFDRWGSISHSPPVANAG